MGANASKQVSGDEKKRKYLTNLINSAALNWIHRRGVGTANLIVSKA